MCPSTHACTLSVCVCAWVSVFVVRGRGGREMGICPANNSRSSSSTSRIREVQSAPPQSARRGDTRHSSGTPHRFHWRGCDLNGCIERHTLARHPSERASELCVYAADRNVSFGIRLSIPLGPTPSPHSIQTISSSHKLISPHEMRSELRCPTRQFALQLGRRISDWTHDDDDAALVYV